MQETEFWPLIEQARADATGEGQPSGSQIGTALTARLAELPTDSIVDFYRCQEWVVARAHQWDLCAAAHVIWGRISDDSFSDFKAGLIGLGHTWFERVVAAADALADHPMVREIAAGRVDRFALAAEEIQYAASSAFEQRTDDTEGFWDAVDTRSDEVTGEEESQPHARWTGHFGSTDDGVRIPLRLPRLFALFPEHRLTDG